MPCVPCPAQNICCLQEGVPLSNRLREMSQLCNANVGKPGVLQAWLVISSPWTLLLMERAFNSHRKMYIFWQPMKPRCVAADSAAPAAPAVALCASALPLSKQLEPTLGAYQAAVCSSALEVRDDRGGLYVDAQCLQSCSAALHALQDLQWLDLHGNRIGTRGAAQLGLQGWCSHD
jgi:hypothetical protein